MWSAQKMGQLFVYSFGGSTISIPTLHQTASAIGLISFWFQRAKIDMWCCHWPPNDEVSWTKGWRTCPIWPKTATQDWNMMTKTKTMTDETSSNAHLNHSSHDSWTSADFGFNLFEYVWCFNHRLQVEFLKVFEGFWYFVGSCLQLISVDSGAHPGPIRGLQGAEHLRAGRRGSEVEARDARAQGIDGHHVDAVLRQEIHRGRRQIRHCHGGSVDRCGSKVDLRWI